MTTHPPRFVKPRTLVFQPTRASAYNANTLAIDTGHGYGGLLVRVRGVGVAARGYELEAMVEAADRPTLEHGVDERVAERRLAGAVRAGDRDHPARGRRRLHPQTNAFACSNQLRPISSHESSSRATSRARAPIDAAPTTVCRPTASDSAVASAKTAAPRRCRSSPSGYGVTSVGTPTDCRFCDRISEALPTRRIDKGARARQRRPLLGAVQRRLDTDPRFEVELANERGHPLATVAPIGTDEPQARPLVLPARARAR